ncbi:MGH1-like glycoside hydrolase domain-containing protein [Methylobacterium oryzae CBMB20]
MFRATPSCGCSTSTRRWNFPTAALVEENRRRGLDDPEYELLDTGLFDAGRYFDVEIAYAKAGPDDILMRVTAINRGPEAAALTLLPQLWARNVWSWKAEAAKPELMAGSDGSVWARHPEMPPMRFFADGASELLFTENETNTHRLFGSGPAEGFCKDGIDRCVVGGDRDRGQPAVGDQVRRPLRSASRPRRGAHPALAPARRDRAGASRSRISTPSSRPARTRPSPSRGALQAPSCRPGNAGSCSGEALAGMLWSKQLYHYDVREWLAGDPAPARPGAGTPAQAATATGRICAPTTSSRCRMPGISLVRLLGPGASRRSSSALIDPDFAKNQLLLLVEREPMRIRTRRCRPTQWGFGDANPPIHALAAWRVFELDRSLTGRPDHAFLKRIFNKLTLNFTWWVNRKDADDRNLFQGGFLGLDNIGIFDRSKPVGDGATLTQSDATAWMATYALNLMRIAIELAVQDPTYEDMAEKFFEHFLLIAGATGAGVWDEADGFFYDVIETRDGRRLPIRARTMVGLIPIFAVATIDECDLQRLPALGERMQFFLRNRPDLATLVSRWNEPGQGQTALLSLLRGHRLKALLRRALDPAEFLSDHGLRAVSRAYAEQPFCFAWNGSDLGLAYEPAESRSRLFGGNSNWRGPIWMPVNYLLIAGLHRFHDYYGPDFRVEAPTGSGRTYSLQEVARDLSLRLIGLSTRGPNGQRPVYGASRIEQEDPHFRDLVLFYEYYDGDTGRGVGAAHQTGWSGLVALLIQEVSAATAGAPISGRR